MKGETKRFSVRVPDKQGIPKISADAVLGLAEFRTRHGIPRKDKLDIPNLHEMVDQSQQQINATGKEG
jgi:hypothetical protein